MKVTIPENSREQIEEFLSRFDSEISTLESAAQREVAVHARLSDTASELTSLRSTDIEKLDDKIVLKRLVANSREQLLTQFIAQLDESVTEGKRRVATLGNEA